MDVEDGLMGDAYNWRYLETDGVFWSGIVLYFMQGFQPGAARKSERQEEKK